MQIWRTVAALAAVMLTANAAGAAGSDKCEAAKNKVAGAYYACRAKAEAAAIVKGGAPDFSKCSTKFDEKWDTAETKGAGDCPDSEITADVNDYLATQASDAAAIIAGTAGVPVCGDGLVNAPGEQCDSANLDGSSCSALGHDLGELACGPGCTFDVSDCGACPGLVFGGACWLFSTVGGDCATACSAVGLDYDTATDTFAGSSGSDANCLALMDAMGALGSGLGAPSGACPAGLGCGFTVLSNRYRCASPATTSTALFGGTVRACACK